MSKKEIESTTTEPKKKRGRKKKVPAKQEVREIEQEEEKQVPTEEVSEEVPETTPSSEIPKEEKKEEVQEATTEEQPQEEVVEETPKETTPVEETPQEEVKEEPVEEVQEVTTEEQPQEKVVEETPKETTPVEEAPQAEVVPEEPVIIEVQDVENVPPKKKKKCKKCKTPNDLDAKFCKQCGNKFKEKIGREDILLSISKILQILAIAVALDSMVQVRPHVGTARGDNIIIEYAFLLATTLLLATIFRLFSNNVTPKKIINNKFKMTPETSKEAKLVLGAYILATFLFIFSNSRMVFLKPGNNYIERRVGEYVQRWDNVKSYSRTGVRKCPRVNWYSKYLPNYTFFCYEYTYSIQFKDGESCFIKYRTKHNNKVNQETFSYCDKK